MELLLLSVYALIGATLTFLILIQQSKGSDIGAAFGSGSSNALFGPVGPGNFLTRATAVLAALFFGLSLLLAWQAKQSFIPEADLPNAESLESSGSGLTAPPASSDSTQ
ncbi:MAG: preprotein translocase subunit SecG [Gammaproteobacteria bacterium]